MSILNRNLKTFYFIKPLKEQGFPELFAYTQNEYIAIRYVEQYCYLQPEIYSEQAESIKDPRLDRLFKTVFNDYGFDEQDEIYSYDITPFGQSKVDPSSSRTAYMTPRQEMSILETGIDMYTELTDLLISSFLRLFKCFSLGYFRNKEFGMMLNYIYRIYIKRLIIISRTDISELNNQYRKILHLPTQEEMQYISSNDIINYFAVMYQVILNNDPEYMKMIEYEKEMHDMYLRRIDEE